jgi:hypothetical protein
MTKKGLDLGLVLRVKVRVRVKVRTRVRIKVRVRVKVRILLQEAAISCLKQSPTTEGHKERAESLNPTSNKKYVTQMFLPLAIYSVHHCLLLLIVFSFLVFYYMF